jgi:hypothetical protein
MFYCDPCAVPRSWPTGTISASVGPCELCGTVGVCNDVPSSLLPLPADVEPVQLDRSSDRYFVTTGGAEREVDLAGYIAEEQAAGFFSHSGPGTPATGSFSGNGRSGRIEYSA